MFTYSFKNSEGFTLVEMIIVIAIVAAISIVSFSGLSESTDHLALQDATRETADFYRQAQNYATNIRINPNEGDFVGRFGIFVDRSNPSEVILYADSDSFGTEGKYDVGEEMDILSLNRGMFVSEIVPRDIDDNYGSGSQTADVLFSRPFVDADIKVDGLNGTVYKELRIEIENNLGQKKNVIIGATGYIFAE